MKLALFIYCGWSAAGKGKSARFVSRREGLSREMRTVALYQPERIMYHFQAKD